MDVRGNTQATQKLQFDIIILGASGFTGKYVVREALKFLKAPSSSSPLKSLALAGRNPKKVAQALQWAAHPSPPPLIPILTADTTDPPSLHSLCSQTKLILNCIGPFGLHGEPVVAACLNSGCDYLDICGEPDFVESMEAKYHEKAMQTGSFVISGCGFDSVPAELGLMFNLRQWIGSTVPNRVEAYLSLESDKRIALNFGTYESSVLVAANAQKHQRLMQSRTRRLRPVTGLAPPKWPLIEFQKKIGLWALKLPSADSMLVQRTLSYLAEKPHGLSGVKESAEQIERRKNFWSKVKTSHFGVNVGFKSFTSIFILIIVGIIIGLFSTFAFGRWLLLKFPSVFSLGFFKKNGPSEDEVKSASFKMWFVGHGFSDSSLVWQGNFKPDMEVITRITGPELAYSTTPIILVQCALIVLSQRSNLPKGGVLPPGIVFGPTDLQQRLQGNGISFDVISKNTLPA